MRPTTATLLLAATVLSLGGCNVKISSGYSFDFKGSTATKSDGGEVDSAIKTIKIKNRFGDIEVLGASDPGTWSWEGKVWATDQSNADSLIDQLEMKVTTDGDTQTWSLEMPKGKEELRGVNSKLAIHVPAEITVLLDNEHGDVNVSAISESVGIDHEHGDIDLSLLSGEVTIQHEHGKINATQLSAGAKIESEHSDLKFNKIADSLEISSEHGDIDVSDSSASVSLTSEHGEVKLETSGNDVQCNSEHGDLKIIVNNPQFESIRIVGEHSDIDVHIPSDVTPKVTLTAEHGSTSSDFESSQSEDSPVIMIRSEHGDIAVRGS